MDKYAIDEVAIVLSRKLSDGPVILTVNPGKRESVLRHQDGKFIVNIAEQAQDNLANEELVRFLSKLLKCRVRIKSGFTSKTKTIVLA
jgi:uncharacterized protein YggU (UPF0235/DUF167 family)